MSSNVPATTGKGEVPAENDVAEGRPAPEEERNLYDINAITRSIRRWTFVGVFTILLFFGGFIGWAAVAELDSAAIAPGSITVFTNRQAIQHLEGGIVREIRKRDGDMVKAGDIVLVLDDTSPRANLEINRKRYRSDLALEARLAAERDGLQSVRFPKELLDSADDEAKEIVQAQDNVFQARRKAIETQESILRQRIVQSKEQIGGLQAQQRARADQIKLISEEVATVQKLLETGNALKPRLLALQRARAELEGQRGDLVAQIARVNQVIGETELQILNLGIDQQRTVALELREVQARLLDTGERIRVADDALRRTNVIAPVDGEIVGLKVFSVGAVLRPGDVIMEVVPTDDVRIVEARVNPNDIDTVRVGSEARVRFSAFSRKVTPQVDAKVIAISADKLVDPQTGQPYYLAKIAIPLESLRVADLEPDQLLPGMPASVLIWTGNRTALAYFIQPFTIAMQTAFRED